MMKRLVCLILSIVCVFALVSCGDDADGFVTIANASKPTKIITQITYNDGSEKLTGRYETVVNGSETEMIYEYQRYATVEEGVAADDPSGYIKTEKGTVYYKDGKYSEDGENWFVEAPNAQAMQVEFNLTSSLLGKYTVSKDGKTLTTVVTSEQAKKMLGIEIDALDDEVNIEIVHDGTYLRSISVFYATEKAVSVSVETSYSYGKINVPETEE